MNYSPEDYLRLYGDKPIIPKRELRWVDWAIVGLFAVLVAFQWGCDGQAAEATQESIVDAQMKKQALMEQPCTWVAQCMRIEMECPVKARRCVRGNKL